MPDRTLRLAGLIPPRLVRNTGGPKRRGVAQRALAAVLAWQERARERSILESLDERQLRNVGLTRADIPAELDKPAWWRR